MSDAVDVMALASSGANVLVAEMAKAGWEAVRSAMARLFRRGGDDAASRQLELLDVARQELMRAAGSDRAAVAERLRQQWLIQLAAVLQVFPEAVEDLRSLIAQAPPEAEGDSGARLTAQGNTNSQVIMSGGSINAGDIHYGVPGRVRRPARNRGRTRTAARWCRGTPSPG
jgi:hypothetical protein